MRKLTAEARLHFRARRVAQRASVQFHTVAVYSSLALIAAIVFGGR